MATGKRDPVSHRTPQQSSQQWQKGKNKPGFREANKKRMQARRKAIKAGMVQRGDGKDVHHVKPIRSGGGNAAGNLRVAKPSANRANSKKVAARGGRATRKKKAG